MVDLVCMTVMDLPYAYKTRPGTVASVELAPHGGSAMYVLISGAWRPFAAIHPQDERLPGYREPEILPVGPDPAYPYSRPQAPISGGSADG